MSQEFHSFLLLPPEIRTMVWEYALPEPRVYEVMDVPHAKQKMNAADGLMFANVHHEPPPPLAAVCRESRGFVLHHYRPLTLGRTTKYVDLSRDLLLLEPYLLLKRLHRTLHFMSRIPLIRDHLAGLALGTSYGVYTGICHPVLSWKVSKSNMGKLLTGLAKFPKLKALLFVVHQEFQFEFDYCCAPAPGLPASRPTPPPQPFSSHLPPPPHALPGPGIYSSHSLPTGLEGTHQAPLQQNASPHSSPSSRSSISPSPLPSPMVAHLHYPPVVPGSFQQLPPPTQPPPMQLPLPPVPPMRSVPAPQSAPSRPLHTPSTTQINDSPSSPPLIHQAQAIPAPQPAAPQALRPQVVHQAYRFKFDIEGNINRHPRRPHLNQLLFYPLEDKSEVDEKDDWEALLNAKSSNNPGDLDEEDPYGEFFDPWPSNEDWRRFRQRFRRQVVATLQAGLATGDGQNAFCVDADINEAASSSGRAVCGASVHRSSGNGLSSPSDKKYQQYLHQTQKKCDGDDYDDGYSGPHNYNSLYSLHGSSNYAGVQKKGGPNGHRRRYSLKHKLPAIKGASLLWRYTRGE
ncbi:hypothetical protein HMPREF1624_00448 [Sporothrix schenckii ATCC 58251]|uniref:2EXR domain-containing protein n=1 Tax=Sporothrix schenckii (strain ATCC 58251 / de Perez 2211183) TaxID=1391915 RepID=U7Q549_SPOS1|nr:hypothetical protein HMPREF1624_00448 [Sporothrix schenckii ATCC 58251]